MAASDDRQTEAVQSPADEKWVFLQDGGYGAKELLLEEQDGDARGAKEFLRWCRSAWNDVPVRNDIWDDVRPYILGITVSVNTVLQLLAAFASSAECEIIHAILTFLGNFTMAVLCPAVYSYATRFLCLLAGKASVVKKVEVNVLLFCLLGTNAVILVAGCFAWIYEVCMGLAVSAKAWRQVWYLRLPVSVFRLAAFFGAIVSFPALVALMKTDVVATFHTFELHWRETEEARKVFTKRWLHPLKPALLGALIAVVCFFMIIGIVLILVVFGVIPDLDAQAASRGI
ncbi:uncharacterized protein LOC125760358 [Rhipicephalus sanguineus]|uniref:uncharacterized protein LOC125760358 n=1 Tax=Rhipicephalus sanguineus TaxID=34632 RepID=UPI0020C26A68|nr:uncharacterized protein LOC125760358 [Rhipicephalus sanguineus]